jgi:hypothetical protein
MDELRALLAATRAEGRSLAHRLERGMIYSVVFGFLALACAFTTVAFLGVAIYAAALQDHGPIGAACFAALGAAVLMAALLFTMHLMMQPKSRPPAPEPRSQSPIPGFPDPALFKQPKTVWDLVTLVAAGVLAGLAEKRGS